MSLVPVLETERLILREFRRSDLDAHAATLGDAEVMRHIGGEALSREDSWRRLAMSVGLWSLIGMGPWVVERRSDGRYLGHIGFFNFERNIQPSIAGEPEMGWIFDRAAQGQGYATEAGTAALRWADEVLKPDSIPAIIDLENEPSMRLAERLGFIRQGDAIYRDKAIAMFRRDRPA
jgi:RimJ/RimL family protein N-acetyltransferase